MLRPPAALSPPPLTASVVRPSACPLRVSPSLATAPASRAPSAARCCGLSPLPPAAPVSRALLEQPPAGRLTSMLAAGRRSASIMLAGRHGPSCSSARPGTTSLPSCRACANGAARRAAQPSPTNLSCHIGPGHIGPGPSRARPGPAGRSIWPTIYPMAM
ncbi:hypothetical protein GQ55_2G089800 [Panicum hallii var. hallii]|uniref:Uncharacterized protein n=1 Tax=Panicum hallii var. hallii TaxID=1504633 RepID=A0A2T7EN03_9POAL|nr:hypothetical protein GQ55_2G089800 [Panicum hallii var. hallii]